MKYISYEAKVDLTLYQHFIPKTYTSKRTRTASVWVLPSHDGDSENKPKLQITVWIGLPQHNILLTHIFVTFLTFSCFIKNDSKLNNFVLMC